MALGAGGRPAVILWAVTPEMTTTLVWTAIEILFDLRVEREKTKAISRALSTYGQCAPSYTTCWDVTWLPFDIAELVALGCITNMDSHIDNRRTPPPYRTGVAGGDCDCHSPAAA